MLRPALLDERSSTCLTRRPSGPSPDRIVKTTVYLRNLDDFQGMNEVYRQNVGDVPPARATLEVSALPSGALVEIDAIALA